MAHLEDDRGRSVLPARSADPSQLVDVARVVLVRMGALDWTVDVGEFWCTVKPAGAILPGQGWKLHVSATQLTAPVVLARVTELLVGAECSFKFTRGRKELGKLLSNRVSRGAGGKFITVYPLDDEQFRRVAPGLDEVSDGLGGPRILSDRQLRPGSSVYYRYGVISSPRVFTNDGQFASVLTGPRGELLVDERRPVYSPPAWATPPVPEEHEDGDRPSAAVVPMVLIADRFAVRGAIRHSYRGGVFRAVDQHTGEAVVLKQARRHALSSLIGTDACDLLRHEARMLDVLGPLGLAPRKVALVTHQDSEYLAQEQVPGETLHTWVAGRAAERWRGAGAPWDEAVGKAQQLVDLVAAVHGHGFVLGDFKPHNVMVTPDGTLRLIDLEAATRTGTLTLPFATRGYAAPEQAPGTGLIPAPSQRADLFGLGATILYLASGVDPVLPPDQPAERGGQERLAILLARIGRGMDSVRRLAPLVTGLMHDEPDRRWTLAQAREFLVAASGTPHEVDGASHPTGPALPAASVDRLLSDALQYTIRTMTPGERRLWTPGEGGEIAEPCCVQHGSAGVLGVLTRAAQVFADDQLRESVGTVARWTDERYGAAPRILPGLYFGSSGPAWALYDAAVLLGDSAIADRAIAMALQVPLRWPNPDVCHGMAGAGMTQLHLWAATGDTRLRLRAVEAADEILAAAREVDGNLVWPVPETFESSLAGQSNYGFAHGVAGIGTFLLAAALVTDRSDYHDAARRAGDTLAGAADIDGDAAWWRSTVTGDAKRRSHWCHGSSGVGTFLIRLWAATGEERFRDLAEAAGAAVHYGRWYTRNAACHGLAGDGEFLLDLAHFTGDERHRDRAWEIAAVMDARHTLRDGLTLLTDAPDDEQVIVDYNTGLAGAAAFLLRLRHGGHRWWMLDDLMPNMAPPGPYRVEETATAANRS